MSPDEHGMVPLQRAPSYAAATWGPYYDTLHPPCRVHFIVNWKVVPGRMDQAARLWQRRQLKRRAYETVYGAHPEMWPTQHPGITLGANAACLGCNWFHVGGSYRSDGVYEQHWRLARRHEETNGTFRGDENRLQPTVPRTPSSIRPITHVRNVGRDNEC